MGRFAKLEVRSISNGTAAVVHNARLYMGANPERAPDLVICFLEFIDRHGPEPVRRQHIPRLLADEGLEDLCFARGLIRRSSSGIFLHANGQALLAEQRIRLGQSPTPAPLPVPSAKVHAREHNGEPRTPEVKRLIDAILWMMSACRLLELDREDFHSRGNETDRVPPRHALICAAAHYQELKQALREAQEALVPAAWALGSSVDEPSGDYKEAAECLARFESQLRTAFPQRPTSAQEGEWARLGASLDDLRLKLQHVPLRTTPMGGGAVLDDILTLDQAAALVGQSKRSLERDLGNGEIPEPDYRGGGGKPNRWKWSTIRPALLKRRPDLPERFPGARIL